MKTNQEDHLKMNSNIPAEKGLSPGLACARLCASACGQGGKVLVCKSCTKSPKRVQVYLPKVPKVP